MNRAFIFDMDGVLVNSERAWKGREAAMLLGLFGKDIAVQLGDLIGTSIEGTYAKAQTLGTSTDYATFLQKYNELADRVYVEAEVTKGLDTLTQRLLTLGYRLGIVTLSPQQWLDQVMPRLPLSDRFEYVLSLFEHPELEGKPAPDGYLRAFSTLNADPKRSLVLEDSNTGIRSGKASGAYVIGFREHLVEGYQQEGADAYADTMDDVIKLVESFDGD